MLAGQVVVTCAPVFAVSSTNGDILPGTQDGLYAFDTRFLSTLRILLEDLEPNTVGAGQFDHSIASFYASSRDSGTIPSASVSIIRDRYIAEGLHEDICLVNHSDESRNV